ncbi:hypothetical protein BDN70DRAFT_896888 [Pholiota conissans]|uniref:MYND-type domain-containing protein n=1 Tax=Pholiota conissans TaxID=109636 RepID=A0A9P5YYQ8_9AGAR|nr:hypothetical protein BDN70DRAFT_896888 [Pholiota conissans]
MALIRNIASLDNLFSNPKADGLCARCLLGASSKRAMHEQKVSTSTTQYVGFWGAQMRFLFAIRTEEETRQLLSHFDRCTCRVRDSEIREYHRIGKKMEEALLARTCVAPDTQTPSIAFITHLFLSLLAVLENTNVKAVARRTSAGHWPTCPEDLMPFGPEELVNSFLVWSRFVPDLVLFHVAAVCARFCGSILKPYATKPALTARLIDGARELFDRTRKAIELEAPTKRRAMGKAYIDQVKAFLHYFNILYDGQPNEQKMTMLDGYEVKALQVCSLLLYAVHDPRLLLLKTQEAGPAKKLLENQASQFCCCIALYINPLPVNHTDPSLAYSLKVNVQETTNEGSATTVEHSFSEDEVDYDGCPNSMQSTGKSFQRCSACNVASYCSPKCQSESWISSWFPHKDVCRVLKTLISVAGAELLFATSRAFNSSRALDESAMVVARKWYREGVAISDLDVIGEWASHRMHPVPLPVREEYEPGYEDYEEIIGELCSKHGGLQAQRLSLSIGLAADF